MGTVHWSEDCATEWAKYETLKGSIVIEKGNDRGSTNITIAELTGHISDTNSRNVAHVRSRFEIQEIDQIVLRLNRVEGDAMIKKNSRRCFISILDESFQKTIEK